MCKGLGADFVAKRTAYLPIKIKAPAAIARISSKVRIVRIPPPSRPVRPIKMSQIPSKSIPIFFVIVMLFTP